MSVSPSPIEFFFDFSSPYAYLASTSIDAIAAKHGRIVAWKPMLLGAVFKVTGSKPLVEWPLKGAYARHDMVRSARRVGLALNFPAAFPFSSIAAARAFYWLAGTDPDRAVAFAQAVFDTAFVKAQDVSGSQAVAEIATQVGCSAEALLAAIALPEWKERLRAETDRALELGVFGAPTMIVDGEKFWGADRLDHLDDWLARGGW
jgi:2-hydroxychromene-2-carboxylate isomerase